MPTLDIRDVYKNGLVRLEVGSSARSILLRIIAADDKGLDFEEALRSDRFFTTKTLTFASEALKKGEVNSLSHAVVLIGKNTIRDFVLGHTLRRISDKGADDTFTDLAAAKGELKRALAAEELAVKCKYEYPGMAFAVGFLFDLFEHWILSDANLTAKFMPLLEETWKHALRSASISWALSTHPRVQVNLKRITFGAALAHDIGKLFMACCYPVQYEPLLKKMEEAKLATPTDDSPQTEIEKVEFGFSHAEIGSFLFSKFDFLNELEGIVDFHHDFAVLKTRNTDLFILATVNNIADRLAFRMETDTSFALPDITKITEQHKQIFPLRADEVQALVLALRGKQLLP